MEIKIISKEIVNNTFIAHFWLDDKHMKIMEQPPRFMTDEELIDRIQNEIEKNEGSRD